MSSGIARVSERLSRECTPADRFPVEAVESSTSQLTLSIKHFDFRTQSPFVCDLCRRKNTGHRCMLHYFVQQYGKIAETNLPSILHPIQGMAIIMI
ncbi:hypothetical protein NQ317_014130 [Molorchus minor]|uniref:Uncharacterized protein n=1 Tax=Molorchus minor TaxID=1323400 RepID=A0ABQ9JGI1_9CUCU|nr:hypothetical protein NQ317_014130 [Molorchus minor]